MELDPNGFPVPFLQRMERMLGSEYPAFLERFALGSRHHGLRVNPLKLSPQEFLSRHGEARHGNMFAEPLTPVPWAETGFIYDEADRPGKSPLHEAGLYYIQEPSAMSAVEALDVKPGLRVLDLCAAPGGKTTQIAGKMMGEGLLIANEIIPSRAKILSQNIERMGIGNTIVLNETPARLAERFPSTFDRILVDAPCSGEGMYRKNDIALTEWSEDNVKMCAARQDEILDAAARMLAPGGRIVYSTCTFSPDEDEGSICRFLAAHPEFSLDHAKPEAFFEPADGRFLEPAVYHPETPVPDDLGKALRVWPHKVDGEGHFLAALTLSADAPDYSPDYPVLPIGSGRLPKAEAMLYREFAEHTLSETGRDLLEAGVFTLFGSELYIEPAEVLPLDRLKVVRCGIHTGSFLKNRFEPAHALALALKSEDFSGGARVGMEEATRFLRGETLDIAAEKGWQPVILCEKGGEYPLGWCKSDGRRLKNHYPKGLRKL